MMAVRNGGEAAATEKGPPPKSCFVISQIGEVGSPERDRADKVLRHVITPAVMARGYGEPLRAERIAAPGVITSQIVEHVLESDLVVADLTGQNANVFYELALRHAVRKPVVQLIARGEKIPFDVAPVRTIQLDHQDLDSAADARKAIEAQIVAVEKDPALADNPVTVALDLQAFRKADGSDLSALLQQLFASVQQLRADVTAGAFDHGPSWSPLPVGFGTALPEYAGKTLRDLVPGEHSRVLGIPVSATMARALELERLKTEEAARAADAAHARGAPPGPPEKP
jgi:hypothetical protein